jgi:predicted esterase
MKIVECKIVVERTASYSLLLPENKIKRVVFVIHGYAQLAKHFIKDFDFLDDGETLIVAPEGLSRFYSRDKVGASWMTKVNRDDEIGDYIKYLDKLESSLTELHDLSSADRIILGFSQGVHTAARWFTESKYDHSKLILCSSDFPADVDFIKLKRRLNGNELIYIQGKEDAIVGIDTFRKGSSLLTSNGIPHKEILFEGKHVISKEAVTAAMKK